jgi:hypothetical protein
MAANRASAQQGLTIALIVFVMLTFILAVTTYLFFKKATDAETAMTTANGEASKAKGEMQKVADDRSKLLNILGFPEDKPVADVETETNEAFEKKFGDFRDDQKAYLKLSDWLLASMKTKDEQNKQLQAEKTNMEQGKDKALADARNRQNELEQLLKKQEADAEAERSEFNKGRERYEELTAQLQADLKKANEASDRMKLLVDEIAKGDQVVAVDRQAKYKAAKAEGQIGQLYDELRDRERMIARQNEILAELRVADKSVQDMVLAATPKDDRIDGFDGQVTSINEVEGTLLLNLGSTQGLRTGTIFNIYNPNDPRPQIGAKKATVEIQAIEGPSLARARVRHQSSRDPILAGDGAATSLWSPGRGFEAVFIGYLQVDRDSGQDSDDLARLVERSGGRVEPSVTPTTTLLVDAGPPRILAGERPSGWRQADETRRERMLKEAKRLGIRVVGVDTFLDMMGLDRSSFDTNRLRPAGRPAVPAGS